MHRIVVALRDEILLELELSAHSSPNISEFFHTPSVLRAELVFEQKNNRLVMLPSPHFFSRLFSLADGLLAL